MFLWDDLRHFLAVARAGSTVAAARLLRVSQPTVARRVAALEASLGLSLFDRRQGGLALTAAGERLRVHAERVEQAALNLENAVRAETRTVGGIVRLSAHGIFADTILPPILRDLHAAYPAVHIELDASDEVRDIGAGAADIALRSSVHLTGDQLVVRRVADDEWTFYCSREYAEEHGAPASPAELGRHAVIGGGGSNVWPDYQQWLQQTGTEEAVVMHHGSATGMLNAVRSGFGVAQLPCLVADLDPELVRCFPPEPLTGRRLWLVTHQRLRRTPHIRLVMDFASNRLLRLAREAQRIASAREGDPGQGVRSRR
ncbi:MAG: LysR family transcriptional regulator [Pseudomonadota bacterium]|nr:LysR family transcriptional regulator [Pseudomonadota bacterium]